MNSGSTSVVAARQQVGVRFRPQGRDPRVGLDCVGLAALALGIGHGVPRDYAMRGARWTDVAAWIAARGLRACAADASGALLLLAPGAGQRHLAIGTGDGFVHADAGIGRVVEVPGPPPWPLLGAWRWEEG